MVHHSCWSLVFQFWMIEVNRSPQNPPQRPSKRSSANLRSREFRSHSKSWINGLVYKKIAKLSKPSDFTASFFIWQGPVKLVKLFPPVLGITHWDHRTCNIYKSIRYPAISPCDPKDCMGSLRSLGVPIPCFSHGVMGAPQVTMGSLRHGHPWLGWFQETAPWADWQNSFAATPTLLRGESSEVAEVFIIYNNI